MDKTAGCEHTGPKTEKKLQRRPGSKDLDQDRLHKYWICGYKDGDQRRIHPLCGNLFVKTSGIALVPLR